MFKEELIIIRHGRSQHNVRKSNSLDAGLTDFGWLQAKNVGLCLNAVELHGRPIYTSPFLRCLETTAGITENYKSSSSSHTIIVDPLLREYLNHDGQEVFVPDRRDVFSEMNWMGYPCGELHCLESNESFLHRMHSVHDNLPPRSIVVTHGLPAFVLLAIAVNPSLQAIPIWDYSLDNCSISIIRKGRVIWHGRNVYHETEFDPAVYGHTVKALPA